MDSLKDRRKPDLEDVEFLDDDDDLYFDEEDPEDTVPEEEADDDLMFIDDDFDYDVFRFDRAKQEQAAAEAQETANAESMYSEEAFADEEAAYEESEDVYEEASDEMYEDYEEDEDADSAYEDEEYEESEYEEEYEEEDDDATQYIDPEQVKSARVEGFVSVEEEPDLDSMSKKERKKYLKEKKKAEKAQKKEEKKQAKEAPVYDENGEEVKKPKVWKKVLKIFFLTILSLIVAAYVGGAGYFYTHFAPGSVVNDTDVSLMNVTQVQEIIKGQVENYSLQVLERKGASEVIKGTDVGLEYVPDDQVAAILHAQNALIWPYRLAMNIVEDAASTHASVQLDEEKFKQTVAGLNCSDPEQMIAPENSYANLEGNIYAPHPAEEGTTIKPDVLKEVLREALLNTAESVDLDAGDCYTNPEITEDDPEINRICDTKNELIGLSITYHFGDEVDVLDGATTDAWITWDEDLKPTIDEEKIKAWAVEFGKKHDTVGSARTFTGAAGREVTISGGSYGWSVDEEKEIEQVKKMFADHESQDREPIWATTAASHDAIDWGNTYVEVDIAMQHMWYFKDGNCIFENDVVTGLPTPARQTTPGVWSILEKKRNKVLRGARLSDGSYEYETPVAYWARVTWTGIGFHDATWQPSFGGNRYTYAGSHGCINMSYSGVQQFYDLIFEGCPVIVHQ